MLTLQLSWVKFINITNIYNFLVIAVANRFVEEYGLVRLSIGEAMRRVMMEQPKSDLSKQIQNHVTKGLTVPDELAVQALDICLLDMKSQTRGYVLDKEVK